MLVHYTKWAQRLYVVGAKQPTAYSTVQTRGESENEVKSAHS